MRTFIESRVFYLDMPEVEIISLVTIYGKDQQDDLTREQKRVFAAMAK